jgi:hypothetical protein
MQQTGAGITAFRQLRQLNIVPSELCSDEHFLRRVYIDVIGTLPDDRQKSREKNEAPAYLRSSWGFCH